jgi:hypothetical protein
VLTLSPTRLPLFSSHISTHRFIDEFKRIVDAEGAVVDKEGETFNYVAGT